MRKDGIIHWSTLNISVVVSFFYQYLNAYSLFYSNDELPLMKESLLLRLDLYLCTPYFFL